MRKVSESYIVRGRDLLVTNEDYSRLIDRVVNTSTVDLMLGVSLAIATRSYDVYLDSVSKEGYNPKDYADVREDIKTIAVDFVRAMSDSLKLSYKDLLWKVEEAIRVIVVPYEPSSVLFFNKIIDNDSINKDGISLDSEIIYKRVIALLSYTEDDIDYSEESKVLRLAQN